jgi:hypothetical protein
MAITDDTASSLPAIDRLEARLEMYRQLRAQGHGDQRALDEDIKRLERGIEAFWRR